MEQREVKTQINAVTEKEWKGKPFLEVMTREEQVACWEQSLFSLITAAKNSQEIVSLGLTLSKKGNWLITSIEGHTAQRNSSGRGFKASVGAAMDRKEAGIAKYTDRKETAILEAAIRRDSVMCATACLGGGQPSREEMQKEIDYWDSFFRSKYESQ